jgi:Zn/Cd-binding protein ZinT
MTAADKITRYDCGSGGVQYCQGCFTMEESEYGDYVSFEDHTAAVRDLEAQIAALEEEIANLNAAA